MTIALIILIILSLKKSKIKYNTQVVELSENNKGNNNNKANAVLEINNQNTGANNINNE